MTSFRATMSALLMSIACHSVFGFVQFGKPFREMPWIRPTRGTTIVSNVHPTDTNDMSAFFENDFLTDTPEVTSGLLSSEEPAKIEFVPSSDNSLGNENGPDDGEEEEEDMAISQSVNYLRESGRYIADHRDNTAVIHIPGEIIEAQGFSNLLDDIALCWLLGLKIVLVVGGRFKQDCHGLSCGINFEYGHEYHNSIHVTDDELLRNTQEEAGYVRFEVERMLNKSLRLHAGMGPTNAHAPAPNGNVVSGNFYTASQFGVVKGLDYKSTGYPKHVHVEKIQKILSDNDIVLLTSIGTSRMGELVNVNSNHLAAFVAASLRASKVIYLSTVGTVLRSTTTQKRMLDIPLSCSKSLTEYHGIQVHDAGFVSFDKAQETLDPFTVEKLLNLGWSNWSLEKGVKRAHVVGPSDGALLEELFTSMDGANTCVRQENDSQDLGYDFSDESNTFGPVPTYLEQPNGKG